MACLTWIALSLALPAQAANEPAPRLPTVADLAAALVDPETREVALRDVIVLAAWLERDLPSAAVPDQPAIDDPASAEQVSVEQDNDQQDSGLAAELAADRRWLETLALQGSSALAHSPTLDPAAWRLALNLAQQGLEPGGPLAAVTAPIGADTAPRLRQLFMRTQPRLAAALLPEVIWMAEEQATLWWSRVLERAAAEPEWGLVIATASQAWTAAWPTAAKPAARVPSGPEAVLQLLLQSREPALGPPGASDVEALRQARARLLADLPGFEADSVFAAQVVLHVAAMLDNFDAAQYFHAVDNLLAVTASLERAGAVRPEPVQALAASLNRLLVMLAPETAGRLATVDVRLDAALTAVTEVLRELEQPTGGLEPAWARRQLGDAVASLVLLIPDMDFYFDQPVRDLVAGAVDACVGQVASGNPGSGNTPAVFDECLRNLLALANGEVRQPHLAGDSRGPFGAAELQRELRLPAVQRINYGLGFLHERYATGCVLPERPLPNPLEWSYLANTMVWFALQSPRLAASAENQGRLARMREIGDEIQRVVAEQVDCVAGAGAVVGDPVYRLLGDYRIALDELARELRQARAGFRAQRLAAGSDIRLTDGPAQPTSWRPDDASIGPCDPAQVCEMAGSLAGTRALFGLFASELLVSHQAGLGSVQICYDELRWVDRRAELVRPGDNNVANFFGHLAFRLKGRYLEAGAAADVFTFDFRSPDEYHYLFAANTEEVLADSCSVEWVGQRIVSTLDPDVARIVPDRLTYLSAARTLPSRLFAANWDRGAEWRDWFVTGLGVERVDPADAPDVSARLAQRLDSLRQEEQELLYAALLRGASSVSGTSGLLRRVFNLDSLKSMIRAQVLLLYPHELADAEWLRTGLAGTAGLLDAEVLAFMAASEVPVAEVVDLGRERLATIEKAWQALPESTRRSGSSPDSMVHALIGLKFPDPTVVPPDLPAAESATQTGAGE